MAFEAVLSEERLNVAREIDRRLSIDGQRETEGQNETGGDRVRHEVQTPERGCLLHGKRGVLALWLRFGQDQPALAFHTCDMHAEAFQLGRRGGEA